MGFDVEPFENVPSEQEKRLTEYAFRMAKLYQDAPEHVKDLVVPITLMIGDMNDSLSAIEDRIDYWLEQQQPEEENGG
jgi:hypothetical protein